MTPTSKPAGDPSINGTTGLYEKANGQLFQKKKGQPERPLATSQSLTTYKSIVKLREDTTTILNAPTTVIITDKGKQGTFVLDATDKTSLDNIGTTLITKSGLRYKRVISGGFITPEMFGANADDNLDDAPAIQAAIDETCSTVNGAKRPAWAIIFSEGKYLINTTINLANTRTNSTLQRDGLRLIGQGKVRTILLGRTGADRAIIDVTGSQFLSLDNLTLSTDGSSGSSTIGIYSGLFSANPQTQNQTFSSIAILMHDQPNANSHNGTIAYWNFGGEENTHHAIYYRANRPAIITAHASQPLSYKHTLSTLANSHSLGVTTFSGECFMEALASVQPAIELIDVNSVDASNLYISGSTNSAVAPSQFQAIRIRGNASNCNLHGTIEGFAGIAQIYGRLVNSHLFFQLGNSYTNNKAVLQLEQGGEGIIEKSSIHVNMSQASSRPLWLITTTSTNQIASCYVKDSEIFSNGLLTNMMLPEKLLFNPATHSTKLYSADKPVYYIESGKQTIDVPKTIIKGFKGANGTNTIATINLPTSIPGTSAMSIVIKIEGTAGHNIYTSGSSTTLFWQGVLPIVIDQNGKITIGTSSVNVIATVAANPSGNNLTGIQLTGDASSKTVKINLTPATSGMNNEGVYFVGKITLQWMGHSCNAPSLTF